MHATVDRYDTKQYRDFYGPPEAVAAAREGKPIPYGTVLTLTAYAAKVNPNGVPLKDADGRFIKDKLVAVNSMMKGHGFGADIPAQLRDGDWIYQLFRPDGKVNDKANLTGCYQCHLPFVKDDYLTSLAKLAGQVPRRRATGGTLRRRRRDDQGLRVRAGDTEAHCLPAGDLDQRRDDMPRQNSVVGGRDRSDVILKGQSAKLQFDEAGNVAYFCGLHPGMKCTIEVVAK
jgi:hypothetical protein